MARLKYKNANGEWVYADSVVEVSDIPDIREDIVIDSNITATQQEPTISSYTIVSDKSIDELLERATNGLITVYGGLNFTMGGTTSKEWYNYPVQSCSVVSKELAEQYYLNGDTTNKDVVLINQYFIRIISGTAYKWLEKMVVIYFSNTQNKVIGLIQ